jgi:hypothetical protein
VGAASQPPFDHMTHANLERKTVHHYRLGIERADHRIGVGVAEDVKVPFENQQIAGVPAQPEPQDLGFLPFEADRQRFLQSRFLDFPLSGRSLETVGRPGHVEVGVIAELRIAGEMFLCAGDNANAGAVGVIGEPRQSRDDCLTAGHVELPIG